MNDHLANAAETAALFLADHDLPGVACAEFVPERDAARVRFQLAASTAELADLLTVAGELSGEVTATVERRESPCVFTHVQVDGCAAAVPVSVWTHPNDRELSALWSAIGHMPEYGIRARVDLSTLRAAADAVVTSESAA